MRIRLLPLVLALSLTGLFAETETIQVASLVRDGAVNVSFTFAAGYSEDVRAALRSGLAAGIAYDVDLHRDVPVWFDPVVASVAVSSTAQYDPLTRVYTLSRTIDGRGDAPRVTSDEEEVRKWLTVFDRHALFRTTGLEPNAVYYVQVHARSKPRTTWFYFWPFGSDAATGSARFTYIPS
jgi:hypothetical protein